METSSLTTNERGKLVELDKWEEVEDELESAEIFRKYFKFWYVQA